MSGELWVIRCGLVPYEAALEAQARLAVARQAEEVPDLLLLLEHPPVYTRGRRSRPGELPMGEDWYRAKGIEVCDTDRGGAVTYHGPGQLVGYPIVSLKSYRDDVHDYVRRMEQVIVEALDEYGVAAGPIEGVTGVWTREEPRKIGSIGVHVSRSVTTHGFAINVNNDLQPFEWIVPCGIEDCRMTSLAGELGRRQSFGEFADAVAKRFAAVYERHPIAVGAEDLAGRVPGVESLNTAAPTAGLEAALR
jgi:lipoyl(octanoyl) transferase